MAEPRASVTRFVRAVARVENGPGGGPHDPAVARQIMTRLHQQLAKLMGPAAFDVLLIHALALARRAHPVLTGVTAGPGGTLAGLDDAARDAVALEDGGLAIVAHFIELLAVLIGEDLAMRLVGEDWPGAAEEEKQ